MYDDTGTSARPALRASTLWAGGAAAAVVAAGVAIVGFLIVRGVLDLPVLGVDRGGAVFESSMALYAALAGLGALAATGLMHLLLLTTPRPRTFFSWIIGLFTAISMIAPFTISSSFLSAACTATINCIIGLAIGSLVSMSARSALRATRPAPSQFGYRGEPYGGQELR